MGSISKAIAGAGLLALAACGGGGEEAATNDVETLDVGGEDLNLADNGAFGADPALGNEAGVLDGTTSDAGNLAAEPAITATDANLTNTQ